MARKRGNPLDWDHLVGPGLRAFGELFVDDGVHPVDVVLVGGLDGRTLELERGCHQTNVRGPGFVDEQDGFRDLEALQMLAQPEAGQGLEDVLADGGVVAQLAAAQVGLAQLLGNSDKLLL